MGIFKIEFENIKSLKSVFLTFTEVNILLGVNGAGKTNVQKYLNYFYNNMISNNIDQTIFDKKNPYNDCIKIKVTYSLKEIMKMGREKPDSEIIEQLNEYLNNDDKITLIFTQYKDNRIQWSHNYKIRKLIKYLFPFYFIDARNIDLLNWDSIWDIVGDLGQYRSDKELVLMSELDRILDTIYGQNYLSSYQDLKSEFEKNDFNIKAYSNSQLFKQVYKFRFAGEEFKYKENSLNYFSNGSNSLNYLKIFYLVLKRLHTNKWRSPLVILDEPEISLHPRSIDELINIISNDCNRIQTILSTHSPRVVRNGMLLRNAHIFQLKQQNTYTEIKKVKSFENDKLNKVISDREASLFFASAILYVEGVTEYELFMHPTIRKLFPVLDKIELFSYNSNNISLDISHPNQRKMNIPYLLLLDLDKVLNYNKNLKKISIVGDDYNPLKNKEIKKSENYVFGLERILQRTRKRISGLTKKVQYTIDNSTFRFNDRYCYESLVDSVKNYCKIYNVYPVSSTIEGVLISEVNFTSFYHWLIRPESNYTHKTDLIKAYELSTDVYYRVNILRTIVEGNLEPIFPLKKALLDSVNDSTMKDGYKIILDLPRLKKGSGWISEYIDYIHNILKNSKRLKDFGLYFPELADIIKRIEITIE